MDQDIPETNNKNHDYLYKNTLYVFNFQRDYVLLTVCSCFDKLAIVKFCVRANDGSARY